jgi:hypothetical protein
MYTIRHKVLCLLLFVPWLYLLAFQNELYALPVTILKADNVTWADWKVYQFSVLSGLSDCLSGSWNNNRVNSASALGSL